MVLPGFLAFRTKFFINSIAVFHDQQLHTEHISQLSGFHVLLRLGKILHCLLQGLLSITPGKIAAVAGHEALNPQLRRDGALIQSLLGELLHLA